MADLRMRGFQSIPPVIKNLVIANVLVWVAEMTFGNEFIKVLSLHYYKHPDFGVWQVLTSIFLHDPSGFWHIAFNMLALWMFGSTLEDYWGGKRFLLFYLICGIGASIIVLASKAIALDLLMSNYNSGNSSMSLEEARVRASIIVNTITIGASGAINGVMAAFAYLFPNSPMMIFPLPVPVKVKYVVIVYFLADLFAGINPSYGDKVAHFAHVGGAVVGLILVITMNKNNRRTFY
jgi:membrane associated rhomboid family serine protease